jgi:hypothetical protein
MLTAFTLATVMCLLRMHFLPHHSHLISHIKQVTISSLVITLYYIYIDVSLL